MRRSPSGYGEDVFERWMREGMPPQQIMDRIRTNFVMDGHNRFWQGCLEQEVHPRVFSFRQRRPAFSSPPRPKVRRSPSTPLRLKILARPWPYCLRAA